MNLHSVEFETVYPPKYAILRRPYCWYNEHEYSHDERIEIYTIRAKRRGEYCFRCERCGKIEWNDELSKP